MATCRRMRSIWTISRPSRSIRVSSRRCCPTSRSASATRPRCTRSAIARRKRSRRAAPPSPHSSARSRRRSCSRRARPSRTTLRCIGYANRNKRAGDHIIISEVEHISLHNIGKYLEKEGFQGHQGAARSVRPHQSREAPLPDHRRDHPRLGGLGEQRDRHRPAHRRRSPRCCRGPAWRCTSTRWPPRACCPSTWPPCPSTC